MAEFITVKGISQASMDQTAVLIGLDWLEDAGIEANMTPVMIDGAPGAACYFRLCSAAVAILQARLPHVNVLFRTMGGMGRNKYTRPCFNATAVRALLAQAWPEGLVAIRTLDTVPRRYWRFAD